MQHGPHLTKGHTGHKSHAIVLWEEEVYLVHSVVRRYCKVVEEEVEQVLLEAALVEENRAHHSFTGGRGEEK